MPIYAIGDLQGCFDELQRLLEKVNFEPARDRLWLVGDLVARGPKSLETLRFVKDLGDAATVVLGNHDLHLLAIAAGVQRRKPDPSVTAILEAPDRDEIIAWLRACPLLHHDDDLGITMIHAGLPPQWDLRTARALATEASAALTGDEHRDFLDNMYGDGPDYWSETLTGWPRLRAIVNCLTRLRYCTPDGRMDMRPSGPPGTQPAWLLPWFEVPGRKNADMNVVFGHWSSLGYHAGHGATALDSGCVWGGELTALRLDAGDRTPVSVDCGCYREISPD